jgi:hypothetical protein
MVEDRETPLIYLPLLDEGFKRINSAMSALKFSAKSSTEKLAFPTGA